MPISPTARSLKKLRDEGYIADVVEKFIPGANIRRDLFGIIDILGIRGKEILGVQATRYSNISSRVHKIEDHDNFDAVRDAGIGICVHGWRKVKNRWQVRIVDCS